MAIDPLYGCWIWQGRRDREGYARTRDRQLAHVAVYESEVGPVPEGRELDHLCRRRLCVSPHHLEPVKRRENERRKHWKRRAAIDKCPKGHDLWRNGIRTPEGGKVCRTCSAQLPS